MTAKKSETAENVRKRKRVVPTRAAGTPAYENPADELFAAAFANRKSPKELPSDSNPRPDLSKTSTVSTVSTVSQPSTDESSEKINTVGSYNKRLQPTAPQKDFQKVANSVVREVSQGIFNGKSKQMYDFLYSLTRGAITPKRTVRISKPKLMKGTGIGSPQTFYRNINHLESLGLIKRNEIVGERSGNEYEVFLPEEVNLELVESVESVQSVQSVESAQKRVVLVLPETELTVPTQNSMFATVSGGSKTSFKDSLKPDDDYARVNETFSVMTKKFDEAVKKITGKFASKNEAEKWGIVADLLILELEVAASRTKEISSVPAFLTEILRRQFFSSSQTENAFSKSPRAKNKFDTIGKNDSDTYEITTLDEKSRATALEQLREFADDDFLKDFKKWYTEEDWNWMMKELGL